MNASRFALFAALLTAIALAPTAAANGIGGGGPPGCVGSSIGNDNGFWVCVTPSDPSCLVSLVRETIFGPIETCLIPRP